MLSQICLCWVNSFVLLWRFLFVCVFVAAAYATAQEVAGVLFRIYGRLHDPTRIFAAVVVHVIGVRRDGFALSFLVLTVLFCVSLFLCVYVLCVYCVCPNRTLVKPVRAP